MNKFTFAKANAAKLVRLPLYGLAALLALAFPRDRHIWVFGRKTGVGEGPLRLLRVVQRNYPHLRLVWIAQDQRQYEEARSLGLEVHLKSSWMAHWLTLRAAVGVVTHGLGDLCRPLVPGIYLVQLWHGSPLKRIHLDDPNGHQIEAGGWLGRAAASVMANMFRASAKLIRCMPSPSPLVSARFRSAFGLDNEGRIRLTGDPRCDVLLDGDPATRRSEARQLLMKLWQTSALPSRLILFAPTWRDGEADPCLPDVEALREIDVVLTAHDAWLVVRSHPWGVVGDHREILQLMRVKFLPSTMLNDVNTVMNAFDALVTDYSAIAMDYSLLERPIVFLAPDLEQYQRSRGLYESYQDFTGGTWYRDWPEAIGALNAIFEDERTAASIAEMTGRRLAQRYHVHRDANSAERLLHEIVTELGLRSPKKKDEAINVLHVSGCLGGVETYLQLLASHADSKRLTLSFVLPMECALSRYAIEHRMPVNIIPMKRAISPWADFKAGWHLRRVIRRAAPDIVHLHSSKAGFIGRLACLGLGCKIVYTPHAYFFLAKRGVPRALFIVAEWFLDRLSGNITLGTSPSEARRAVDDIGCSPHRVSHILNAVDVDRITQHRTSSASNHVVLVARISAQKNIPMYLDVVRRLRDTRDIRCYLVGVGHYDGDRQILAKMLQDAGLDSADLEVVEWMPRSAVLDLMATAAAVVLTSEYESFGYVLAEANSLGVPVVGTDVDGVRDVIRNGHNGFLIPPGDASAMAEHIEHLLDNPEVRISMSAAAYSEAAERFDIKQAIPRFEQFYGSQLS